MALRQGTHVDRGYATVAGDEGVNYREIAETMTDIGFSMNHSSARNYVLRVMRKFVESIAESWDMVLDERQVDEISKNPAFQHAIADILQVIEARRRARMRANR